MRKPTWKMSLLSNPIKRVHTEKVALEQTVEQFSSSQFMRHEAPFIPEWVYDKSIRRELDDNWLPNMRVIRMCDVPKDANVISSHSIYKVKDDFVESEPEAEGI